MARLTLKSESSKEGTDSGSSKPSRVLQPTQGLRVEGVGWQSGMDV
jgi:hypothetical protein